jgi:hypothetical protein
VFMEPRSNENPTLDENTKRTMQMSQVVTNLRLPSRVELT